ncbi:MAG: GMC family oxidoreductase [Candidatus Dormibacteraeota bacterium]|nr:GMC family oxidoreductase [Candidatus Dormibacteraeota bacterium]
MLNVIVVGSGPAAAGAALALAERPDVRVTVLDVGLRLERERQRVVDRLAAADEGDWSPEHVAMVAHQPVGSGVRGLPEKRAYGSDFPFQDAGQLRGVSAGPDVNPRLISAAYGGFSNVWGSQLMPFTRATLDTWPVSSRQLEPHYRAVLEHIPFAGEEDDLAPLFPLIRPPAPLPALAARSRQVLEAYGRKRAALKRLGITVGRARLAFAASACTRCGLCMTGCPYGLIYSAAQTFDQLRRRAQVDYRGGLVVHQVAEQGEGVVVHAKEVGSGRERRFAADRVFLGCGALGTTRLVMGSLRLFDRDLHLGESAQFTLPMLSLRPVADPRDEPGFTLNQFNMVVALDEAGLQVSQLHLYPYNPAIVDALPAPLRAPWVLPSLLRRLTVAIGYLPSWASPGLRVRARPADAGVGLPYLQLSRERPGWAGNATLRRVLATLVRAAPQLDLYPVLPRMILAAGGKSYHVGGSFPHVDGHPGLASSDRLGRVGRWRRVHLVDASVFPSVAATTFTLTIMANAHRIATEVMELPPEQDG